MKKLAKLLFGACVLGAIGTVFAGPYMDDKNMYRRRLEERIKRFREKRAPIGTTQLNAMRFLTPNGVEL